MQISSYVKLGLASSVVGTGIMAMVASSDSDDSLHRPTGKELAGSAAVGAGGALVGAVGGLFAAALVGATTRQATATIAASAVAGGATLLSAALVHSVTN